jgi:hypothetical protein
MSWSFLFRGGVAGGGGGGRAGEYVVCKSVVYFMSTSQPDETFMPLLYVFLDISFPFFVCTKQNLVAGKVAKTFH